LQKSYIFTIWRGGSIPPPLFLLVKEGLMMELKLNVYKGRKIEKTYTATEYDLMFGTVEDLLDIIDLEKLNDETELAKTVLHVAKQVKPLFKDVFVGLTDDELKRVPVREIVPVILELCKYALNEITATFGGGK
jgi:hypothetical protein